ncbi:MAG: hypothetical protein ACRDRJ_06595 [Streptosporangiaceae bacterium]
MDTLVQPQNETRRYDGRAAPAADDMRLRTNVGQAAAIARPPGPGKSAPHNPIAAGQTPITGTHNPDLAHPAHPAHPYARKSPTLSAPAPPPAPANLQRMHELTDLKRDSDQLGVFHAAQALYRTGG